MTSLSTLSIKLPVRASKFSGAALGKLGRQLLVLLGVLAVWQLVTMTNFGSPALRKGPAEVWAAFVTLWNQGLILPNLWATMQAVIVALVLAAIVGTAIGLTLALLPRTEEAFNPLISGLNSMPRVALAPVFIIAFGLGMMAKIALAFSIVVFMFILNARAGVKSADPDVLKLATAMGMSKWSTFWKVLLPVATPSIFAAIRLGLIYSLLGVVTSELISSRDGLGQLIAYYSSMFDMAAVYGILIMLAVIAALLNALTGWAERILLRWQAPGMD
jgi:NitT/TauT family transport system permease protein